MANLAASAVTINGYFIVFGGEGARKKWVDATLVLTGQGGSGGNNIPPALFGLLDIKAVIAMRSTGTPQIYVASPDPTGQTIWIQLGNATAPADVNGDTVRCLIIGNDL